MSDHKSHIFLDELTHRYPALSGTRASVLEAYHVLVRTFESGGKLLICGNGGSASDADHISGELLKGFRHKRPLDSALKNRIGEFSDAEDDFAERLQGSLPAIALPAQSAIVSAVANDLGADLVYAQQVLGYGKPEDTLLAISTSGNSKNVLKAVSVARALGLSTIALTGTTGGKLAKLCEVSICPPANETAPIQEFHLPIYHALCSMVEVRFFG